MKRLFQPNIGKTGRMVRALIGLSLLGVAVVALRWHWFVTLGLSAAGVFCLFEAARGWCAARACGVKTRW